MKKIIYPIIMIIIAIVLILALVNADIITLSNTPQNNSEKIQATLIINYGNQTTEKYNITLTNATVYSMLMKASETYNFTVKDVYYEEYQTYIIQSINSTENKNQSYWQYYINDEYGTKAADQQKVQNNDIVEWKYEKTKR
ncbi:MAG: DUF4430 domain-containing protein [Candidatus Thermoplasmatota archaeon]